MPKISIIVPVYNDEIYVKRCLNSLINQTLKDIEIIVVNDGSTDNTLQILKEFANNDDRIKVLSQENQKLGAARNNGLEHSTGDYISFVDSDDWVDEDYYEKLYNAAVNNNADIAVSSSIREKASGKFAYCLKYDDEKVYDTLSDMIEVLKMPPYWFVWGKIYKRQLLKNIRFESGIFYEDADFTIRIINITKILVTVPRIKYHYFSNANSILKSKQSIAKQQDQINAMVNVIDYADKHNIKLNEITIFKDRHLLYTTKYYDNHKDFYLLGIKIYTKYEKYDSSRTFVIFNTACFGDVLVCNSLCQNIKMTYPNSKVIFVVNKPFYDVAKVQKDVDEVIVYDKKGKHKGIFGALKFIKEFPYKKPFASFVTYRNCRNMAIAKLIGSRYVFEGKKRLEIYNSMQESHIELLQQLTNKKLQNLPVKCSVNSELPAHLKEILTQDKKYIALCVLTKNPPKDMPLDVAIELINKINAGGYKPVLTGIGENTVKYAEDLRKAGCEFVDLVNKTTILELGSVLQNCKALISVDTGTMHYAYALEVPTTAVFYETTTPKNWAPNPKLYNVALVKSEQTAENIYQKTIDLINGVKH